MMIRRLLHGLDMLAGHWITAEWCNPRSRGIMLLLEVSPTRQPLNKAMQPVNQVCRSVTLHFGGNLQLAGWLAG